MVSRWKTELRVDDWIVGLTEDEALLLDKLTIMKYGYRALNYIGKQLDDDFAMIADMIYLTHAVKWDRLYSGYIAEYDPIANVDGTVTETVTRDLKKKYTGTDAFANTGKDTTTNTGTDTFTKEGDITTSTEGTTTTNNDVYAFDSDEASPAVKDTMTPDLTETVTNDTTDTNTKDLTNETTYGKTTTNTRNMTDTDTGTVTTETVRKGNIGVTMTTQLLDADVTLWSDVKMQFYETVIKDIADYLCLKIAVD